ncbi:ABC transporter permease, partial [Sulfitobacter sp. 1A12057]
MTAIPDIRVVPRWRRSRAVLSVLGQLPLTGKIGLAILVFWLLVLITISVLPLPDPLAMAGRRLQPPSFEFWLGTDALGRDVFSRTLWGAVYTIPIAFAVVLSAVAIGSFMG